MAVPPTGSTWSRRGRRGLTRRREDPAEILAALALLFGLLALGIVGFIAALLLDRLA